MAWLIAVALGSVLVGYLYLLAFRSHAVVMVKATAALQVLLPLGMGITAVVLTGSVAAGSPFFFLAAVAAVAMYLWRDFFGLCGRLLAVATEGLTTNSGIFGVVLLQQLALLVVSLPMLGVMGLAWTNGEVAPNRTRRVVVKGLCETLCFLCCSMDHTCILCTAARGGREGCYGDDGEEVVCCIWQPDNWVFPYVALTALALLWTSFLAFTIRLYVISGTVAQWYFAPATLG